jgi:hypothetical protein
MLSKATLIFGFALAVAVLPVLGCEPAVPASPTFAQNVGPIFAARCGRCHGETLTEGDPGRNMPLQCHLTRFEDMGDCSAAATCSRGAQFCAGLIYAVTIGELADDPLTRMPPPPADPLNDWEKEVITRWATTPLP